MSTLRVPLLILAFATAILRAQESAAPDAAAPAQTEMQKWIATTDAPWQAAFNRDVTDAHAAELKKLAAQYGAAIEAAINKASGAGDLDGAVALRKEQKRFAETETFPEQDEAGEAATVKQLRAATRGQLAKLEKENAARAKALHAKYDQVLAQAQTQLTQRKRLDDALLVKAKRDEVSAAWITPAVAAAAVQQPAPQVAKATPAPPKPASKPTPEPKPEAGKSMDEFFVGKTWQSSAGTAYAFAKDGTCVRQAGSDSETMRWHHLGNRIVEVSGKNKPDTRYFRFVSATEAYYNGDKRDITKPLQLK